MNDFNKRLKDYCGIEDFDLDKNESVAQEVRSMYEAKMKKAKVQFWLRFAAAAAITVYGALGIKYNTGWYVDWALFTALVGANAAFMIVLWYWQLETKLGILREVKQLRIEISALAETKETPQD
jgi:hypothetical protein